MVTSKTNPKVEVTSVSYLPVKTITDGFKWGNNDVLRLSDRDGHIVLCIKSPTQRMVIRVTPRGVIRIEKHEAADGRRLVGRSYAR